MNIETNRLNSFTNWPTAAPVEPVRMAKAGFYYTGQGTEVQCFSCGATICDWDYGDQVMWRHRRIAPNCTFVVNPGLSGNIPFVHGQECPTDEPNTEQSNNVVDSPQDYGVTAEDEMYKSDVLRLLSFSNWEDSSVSREALASVGFYHKGGGRLRCAWCGGELAPFRTFGTLGPPLEVHRMYFPRCAYAASLEIARAPGRVSPTLMSAYSPVQAEASEATLQSAGAAHNARLLEGGASGTWRALGVVGGGARHPSRAALAQRLSTFDRWPANNPQRPQELAEAGFFYTGTDDQVRCFYCDGGLGKWETSDVPWCEHARWFPHCGFVALVKGQEFVEQSAPSQVQRSLSAETGLSQRRRAPGARFPVSELQLAEGMESGVALAALGAGLDAARVRRAIARRLRTAGIPFNSSEALIDAVLDEQLNEEAWSDTPSSQQLTRDILAETLRNLAPSVVAIPDPNCEDNRSQNNRTTNNRITPPRNSIRSLFPITTSANVTISITDEEPATESCRKTISTGSSSDNSINTGSSSDKNINTGSSSNNNNNSNDTSAESQDPSSKKLSLEEENRQLKEARLCKVCMDNEVSVVFLPCGHLVSCGGCGAALPACPLCRAAVRALVRAYLA